MSKKVWLIVGVLAVLVVAFVLIERENSVHDDSSGQVRIGVLLEMTGPLAPYAQSSRRGIDLAATMIGPSLTLVFEDAQTDPKSGVSAFLKLRDSHGLGVVMGGIGSSTVMACAPLANQSRVVFFSCGATSPAISDAGEYVFRNRLSGSEEIRELASLAHRELGISRLAIIFVTTEYGVGNRDVFQRIYEQAGGKVVLSEGFDAGSTDFRSLLTKVGDAQVEGVFLIGHLRESALILKQASELSLDVRFLSTGAIDSPELWEIAGDAAEGVIYSIQAFEPYGNEAARDFNEAYVAKFGVEPDLFAALSFDATMLLYDVMSQGPSTGPAVKSALEQLENYDGVFGRVSFDEHGDIRSRVLLKVASDGRFSPYKR